MGGFLRRHPTVDGGFARATYLRTAFGGRRQRMHRSENVGPVFLVGSGRSGNTLLRRMLQASPQLHIPPETYVLGTAISLFRRSQNLPWPHLVRLILAQFEFHPDFGDFGVSLRPLVNRLTEVPHSRRSLAVILDGFYRYHGEQTGAEFQRWGDKTPLNAYSLHRIHAVFPDGRYVHLLRDGVDVVHSYVASGLMGDAAAAADRWVTSVEAVQVFARRHPMACHEVRYEELVAEPAAVVERVCGFLGVEFDAGFVDQRDHVADMGDVQRYEYHSAVARPVNTSAVGRGRRSLAPGDLTRVAGRLAPLLSRCGYLPPGDGPG
ncbi:MAG: sulfotransferase [Acidimicrobiia bacterium]